MALASIRVVVSGSLAFFVFWVLAVFPSFKLLPIGRTGGALLASVLTVALKVLSPSEAYSAIDLSILALLFATMLVSVYLEKADLFEYLGHLLAWRSRGGMDLLCRVCVLSAILSALFTNDTCCVVLTRFVLKICSDRKLHPKPFLIALATSANIGSVSTPIGNPQNLVIAIISGVPFGSFLAGLLPSMLLGILLNTLILLLAFRKHLSSLCSIVDVELDQLSTTIQPIDNVTSCNNAEFSGALDHVDHDGQPKDKEDFMTACSGTKLQVVGVVNSTSQRMYDTFDSCESDMKESKNHIEGDQLVNDVVHLGWNQPPRIESVSRYSINEDNTSCNKSRGEPCTQSSRYGQSLNEHKPQSQLILGHKMQDRYCDSEGSAPSQYLASSKKENHDNGHNRLVPSSLSSSQSSPSSSISRTPSARDSSVIIETAMWIKEWKRKAHGVAVYLVTAGMLAALLCGLNLSWTALTASVALMVLDFRDAGSSLGKVSYVLLVFFVGMFITVDGFNKTGIPSTFWDVVEPHARTNSASGILVLSLVVIILSNIASNVPTVLLLGSRVAESAIRSGANVTRSWLILAWASTIAGNLTLVGSAANLIVSEEAMKAEFLGYELTFFSHLLFGFPSTLLVLAVGLPLVRG